ncbi:MAG: sugar porter family MFS transporter, partial [Desulfovibrio sp.]|nr:sugar porter family MFS transporter [Desulfovibrio sp.]
SVSIGKLMDRMGYLVWLRLCPLIIAAGAGGVYFSDSFWPLAGSLFVIGLGVGGGYSLDSGYISEVMPAKWESFFVGLAKATCSVGFVGGAAYAYFLLKADPTAAAWPDLILFVGGLGVLGFLLRVRWYQSLRWLMARGETEKAQEAARDFLGPRRRGAAAAETGCGQARVLGGHVPRRKPRQGHLQRHFLGLRGPGRVRLRRVSAHPRHGPRASGRAGRGAAQGARLRAHHHLHQYLHRRGLRHRARRAAQGQFRAPHGLDLRALRALAGRALGRACVGLAGVGELFGLRGLRDRTQRRTAPRHLHHPLEDLPGGGARRRHGHCRHARQGGGHPRRVLHARAPEPRRHNGSAAGFHRGAAHGRGCDLYLWQAPEARVRAFRQGGHHDDRDHRKHPGHSGSGGADGG